MILCDFCAEPITDSPMTFSATMPAPGESLRLDLHPECLPEFAKQAIGIKGKRPATPPPSQTPPQNRPT